MSEAQAFELGANWALGVLAKSLITMESRSKGRTRFDVMSLNDTLAPAIKLIAEAAGAEAARQFPD
jgi:hypothetical protein